MYVVFLPLVNPQPLNLRRSRKIPALVSRRTTSSVTLPLLAAKYLSSINCNDAAILLSGLLTSCAFKTVDLEPEKGKVLRLTRQ